MLKFKSLVSANSTTAAKIGRNKIANFSFAKFMREMVSKQSNARKMRELSCQYSVVLQIYAKFRR